MKDIIMAIQLALAIVPQILELVKTIELKGSGADKASAVTNIVLAALEMLPDDIKAKLGVSKVEAFIRKVIDIAVAFLNKVGAFKTDPAT